MKILVENGVHVNELVHPSRHCTGLLESFSTSALHWLCNGDPWQYSKYISYLLENGADPNIRNLKGRTPLHIVCTSKDASVEIIDLLASAGKTIFHHF